MRSVEKVQRPVPVDNQASREIATALARRVGKGADAAVIADTIVSIWREIDTALRPVIGQRGVAALYKRSVYLASQRHAWLAATYGGVQTTIDFDALESVLAHESSADAAAGGRVLLQTFTELLATLIGTSLTERLLRSVWATSSSASLAQDAVLP